jgi:hypothetical protein
MISASIFKSLLKPNSHAHWVNPWTSHLCVRDDGGERHILVNTLKPLPRSFYGPLNVDRTRPADDNGRLRCFPRF